MSLNLKPKLAWAIVFHSEGIGYYTICVLARNSEEAFGIAFKKLGDSLRDDAKKKGGEPREISKYTISMWNSNYEPVVVAKDALDILERLNCDVLIDSEELEDLDEDDEEDGDGDTEVDGVDSKDADETEEEEVGLSDFDKELKKQR